MFLELCFNVSAISRMNYWWACWLKYAWNWRTQKKPGRWRHISIPNATNSMNKLLSFVSRRHQRFVQKAVVSEIKAARVFASGRNDLLIRKHGTEHARNPSGTSHWYQHPANQHPEQVSHQRLALFKFYSRVSVFPSIYAAHANIAAREHLPAWKSRASWGACGLETQSQKAARISTCYKSAEERLFVSWDRQLTNAEMEKSENLSWGRRWVTSAGNSRFQFLR